MKISNLQTNLMTENKGSNAPDSSRGKLLMKLGGAKPFELFEADLSEAAKKEVAKAVKAAEGAEMMFMKQLADKMMPKKIGGDGQMGDFIRDQLTQAIAESGAKSSALGIGKIFRHQMTDSIYRQEAARILLSKSDKQLKQDTKI